MDGWKVAGAGMRGAGAGGLISHYGLWGLLAVVVLALLSRVPQLTPELLKEIYTHRDKRWVLKDDARTNRSIALQNSTPLPTGEQVQPSPAAPPQPKRSRNPRRRRARPRADPGPPST